MKRNYSQIDWIALGTSWDLFSQTVITGGCLPDSFEKRSAVTPVDTNVPNSLQRAGLHKKMGRENENTELVSEYILFVVIQTTVPSALIINLTIMREWLHQRWPRFLLWIKSFKSGHFWFQLPWEICDFNISSSEYICNYIPQTRIVHASPSMQMK